MKWRGETEAQWEARTCEWHKRFCLLPTQMKSGRWVWLEKVYARRVRSIGGAGHWEFTDAICAPEDVRPSTMPPSGGSAGSKR